MYTTFWIHRMLETCLWLASSAQEPLLTKFTSEILDQNTIPILNLFPCRIYNIHLLLISTSSIQFPEITIFMSRMKEEDRIASCFLYLATCSSYVRRGTQYELAYLFWLIYLFLPLFCPYVAFISGYMKSHYNELAW